MHHILIILIIFSLEAHQKGVLQCDFKKKSHKKIFTVQRTHSFMGKSRTNVFVKKMTVLIDYSGTNLPIKSISD